MDLSKIVEEKALITLDFSGTEKRFFDIDDLRRFIQTQQDAWSWLEQAAKEDGNLDQVWNPFNTYFEQVGQTIEQYETNHEDRGFQTEVINSCRKLTETAVKRGFILAETPIACIVLDLKNNRSPRIAGYTLAELNKRTMFASNNAACEALYWKAQYFQASIPSLIEMQHNDHGENGEQQNNKITELQKQIRLLIKELYEQQLKQASDFEDQITQQAISVKATIRETKKQLADFEASFKEKVALQSPAKYWTTKSVNHKRAMSFMSIITILVAASALVLFIIATVNFHEFKEILEITITGSKAGAESELLAIVKQISILLAISTIGVWLTRLSTKIFISNLHLKMDAEERATMFRAYIALLSLDKGLNDDNRQLILQSLFRPSTTGFIKDEGPTTIPERVAKNVSRKL